MTTWEWFHRQMDSLVSLQIVITVETLWALIAFEWPVVHGLRLLCVCSIDVLHICRVAAVEATETTVDAVDESQTTCGVIDV